VYGAATAASGVTYGVYGQSQSASGRGVLGVATNISGGVTYGVYGQSDSANGAGVFGSATAGSGATYGVIGRSNSPSGAGIYGLSINGSLAGKFDGGIRLNTTTAKPTCDASLRGTFWLTQGGAGVKDQLEVCAKDATDAYAWRTLY
jgi:hypothetical protein